MINEIWKDIDGYNGLYQISSLGRVRNKKGRLISPRKKWNGYIEVQLYKASKKKHYQIHRLVAEAFIPNPNNLPQINHKNEIKFDNRLENLEWCDNSYNVNYSKRRSK